MIVVEKKCDKYAVWKSYKDPFYWQVPEFYKPDVGSWDCRIPWFCDRDAFDVGCSDVSWEMAESYPPNRGDLSCQWAVKEKIWNSQNLQGWNKGRSYWISIVRKKFSNSRFEQNSSSHFLQEIYSETVQNCNDNTQETVRVPLIIKPNGKLFNTFDWSTVSNFVNNITFFSS